MNHSLNTAERAALTKKLLDSPSYPLAYEDTSFLNSDAARGARLQLEFLKPEVALWEHQIRSTVIVFGSARFLPRDVAEERLRDAKAKNATAPEIAVAERNVAMSVYYEQARSFARIVADDTMQRQQNASKNEPLDYVICTGGGPGIMEAANRGAYEAGMPSVGLNIKLPFEQQPNPYITPELCFQFHYFAIRKLHFLLRARALVVCPGGFGTFDEMFEALTLRQTKKTRPIPIIVFGEDFWRKTINFQHLVDTGVICPQDIDLMHFTEDPREAWELIKKANAV
ncbi:MAG: LOG family protein [Thermoguttaceae bacterium]